MTHAVPLRIDALEIRRRLGRKRWAPPVPYGGTGWRFLSHDAQGLAAEILVSQSPTAEARLGESGDWTEWIHASMVRRAPDLPSYEDLCLLKEAVWGPQGEAYQVFAPEERHVNIHAGALHLWGRVDGQPVLPAFGRIGSI